MAGTDTKQRLVDAALRTLADHGIAGTSARTIADRAGVNQALIFYHYATVGGLLAEASRHASAHRAEAYRDRLEAVGSLQELAVVARELHAQEVEVGNLAALTQLLAAARTMPEIVPALRDNFEVLTSVVRDTLGRLLDGTALDGLVPADDLARSISAGFVGLQLLDDLAEEAGHASLFSTLDAIAELGDLVLGAGVVPTAIVRRRLAKRPAADGRR